MSPSPHSAHCLSLPSPHPPTNLPSGHHQCCLQVMQVCSLVNHFTFFHPIPHRSVLISFSSILSFSPQKAYTSFSKFLPEYLIFWNYIKWYLIFFNFDFLIDLICRTYITQLINSLISSSSFFVSPFQFSMKMVLSSEKTKIVLLLSFQMF